MGRIITPKYRVEVKAVHAHLTDFAWNAKRDGRANDENLAKFVASYNESFAPGGVNAIDGNPTVRIVSANLVRQDDGEIVASWTAPLFEVIA